MAKKERIEDARVALGKMRGENNNIDDEMNEIITSLKEEEKVAGSFKGPIIFEMLRNPGVKRALILGCLLQFFQQFSGINTGTQNNY